MYNESVYQKGLLHGMIAPFVRSALRTSCASSPSRFFPLRACSEAAVPAASPIAMQGACTR